MAEVLVTTTQTIPIMNLHSTDAYHGHSSSQSHHHPSSRSGTQVPRAYGTHNVSVPYRGPVAPYAFQSTPNLRQDVRQSSAPVQQRQSVGAAPAATNPNRQSYAPSSSASTASSNSASNTSSNVGQYTLAKEDAKSGATRPESTFLTSSSTPDLTLISFDSAKPSPDRYRRQSKRADSSGSAGSGQASGNPQRWSQQWPTPQAAHQTAGQGKQVPFGHTRTESADDIMVGRQAGLGRYRRRSVGGIDSTGQPGRPQPTSITTTVAPAPTWSQIAARGYAGNTPISPAVNARPGSSHGRNGSAESRSSTGSGARRPANPRQESFASNKSTSSRPSTAPAPQMAPRNASSRSTETARRVASPSPLSKPVDVSAERQTASASPKPSAAAQARAAQSPAVQQLHAVSDANKGMKSRLRRAFSFGSAQELRKASAQNNANKLRKDPVTGEEELQGEDAAIAAQQEAAGFGNSIYTGQGGVYGSTDNLSISSTASSASIMLRKMGRGVKKSTKSIRGLFRPKSIIGDPAADSALATPRTATAEVSLVTVEAEREKVNVNVNPHDQPGGGTGYPKLERNSIDTGVNAAHSERPNSSRHGASDSVSSRKSIIGGDRERQEVLAAVKKGILKRNNTSSPVHAEPNPSEMSVPSIPGTPDSSVKGDDFFITANRFGNGSTRSLPERSGGRGNISWNPKVQFFDVWASNEYDRRGDIATCNRLTPMLAQQIKEELNSFKMEMEVHEMSKPHTHFF